LTIQIANSEPVKAAYFEDVEVHETNRSGEYVISEQSIIDFASEWDPHPFHIDPDYASKTRFGGLFAAGV